MTKQAVTQTLPTYFDEATRDLTYEQTQAIHSAAEEMAEAIQVLNKILRFGLDSVHPDPAKANEGTNRDRLAVEIGHVSAALAVLLPTLGINLCDIESHMLDKTTILTEGHYIL